MHKHAHAVGSPAPPTRHAAGRTGAIRTGTTLVLAVVAALFTLVGPARAATAAPDTTPRTVHPAATPNDVFNLYYWGDYTLSLKTTGRCLDADTSQGGVNGNKVQIWDCNVTTQQGWSFFETSYHSHVFYLVNMRYWKCLDQDANQLPANGTRVQLWDCNETKQQQWYLPWFDDRNGDPKVGWHLFAANSARGSVLDAANQYGLGNGSPVQLWQNLNGGNQVWHIWPWG